MIIHRQSMLTENNSSEHLLAKINPHSRFILINQYNVKTIHRTGVNDFINTRVIKEINPSPALRHHGMLQE